MIIRDFCFWPKITICYIGKINENPRQVAWLRVAQEEGPPWQEARGEASMAAVGGSLGVKIRPKMGQKGVLGVFWGQTASEAVFLQPLDFDILQSGLFK